MRNELSFVRLQTAELFRQPVGYKVRKDCRSWWKNKLSALCWKILIRIGALDQFGYMEKSYHYGEPERKKVSELILKSIDNIWERNEDQEDYCIVIGAKEFQEVMGEYAHDHGYMNVIAGPFGFQRGGYRSEIHNLPVHVVAGVSGVALIPKVLVEKEAKAA